MQTGTISFCGKTALNIKSDDVKKNILEKIENEYGVKIIKRHFECFDSKVSVEKLQKNPHLVYLKSNGNPYFMFLTCIHNVNTVVLIDKKIQQGYFYPRMIIVFAMFDSILFTDTMFDGEMVKDKHSRWVYIINDLLVHKSIHLHKMNLIKRINMIHTILETNYSPHKTMLFSIQVKKFTECNKIHELMEFSESLPYTSRGVIFKPMFIKFKDILFNFDDNLVKIRQKVKIGEDNQFISNESMNKHKVCKIKYTGTQDVYELYENKKFIGIACVNSLRTSKMLSELFKNKSLMDEFDVRCSFNSKFNKWTPYEVF